MSHASASDAIVRGSQIKASDAHDGGAYARCSYCLRFSDNPKAIIRPRFPCDCGKDTGWSGSFVRPDETSRWSEAK